MTYTNFPDGITSMGVPVGGAFTNGASWFLKPGTSAGGNDGNTGTEVSVPVATAKQALSLATAGRNDVIYMIASSDTAANTTDYQTSTLTWNKDLTHLVGINANSRLSQRSRISTSSSAAGASVAPLVTVSANGSHFENIEFFAGAPGSAPTAALGSVLVSGERNVFKNCQISGVGSSTMDAAGQFSLKVTGQENYFEDCTIGLDTVARTSATYELQLSGGATRNIFRNCRIITYAAAATMTFVTVPVNGIDRWNLFENCEFVNMPTGVASGTTINQAFAITGGGSPDGLILLKSCVIVGATHDETTASGKLFKDSGTSLAISTHL